MPDALHAARRRHSGHCPGQTSLGLPPRRLLPTAGRWEAVTLAVTLALLPGHAPADASPLLDLGTLAPDIQIDLRYAGTRNLLNRPLAGYEAPRCLLAPPLAHALVAAQRSLQRTHPDLSLRVYDCYRPQRAVDDIWHAAARAGSFPSGRHYHPRLSKRTVFQLGYFSRQSAHSRGIAVDLTLAQHDADRATATPLPRDVDCTAPRAVRAEAPAIDMGTSFDCLDPQSGLETHVGDKASANRALLQRLMREQGLIGSSGEWWHFQLPLTTDVFADFPIRDEAIRR